MISRHLAKKFAISSVALVVFAGGSEILARVWLGDRWTAGRIDPITWPDVGVREPYRGWALRHDLRARVIGRHTPYAIDLDHDGYRQDIDEDAIAPDALRVLVIGDSVSFGWGVAEEARYSSLLEERLSMELSRPVAIWNMAVPGYSIDQTLWTYVRDGTQVKADVVVLCTVMNDVSASNTTQYNGKGKPALVLNPTVGWQRVEPPVELVRFKPLPLSLRMSARSAAVTLLRRVIETAPKPMPMPQLRSWDERGSKRINAIARDMAAEYGDRDAPIHEALRRLGVAVERDGAKLIIVACPFGHDSYLVDPRVASPPTGRPQSTYSTTVLEACDELGLTAIAVDLAFGRAVADGALLHVGDGHPNERGHDIMAEELLPVIVEAVATR